MAKPLLGLLELGEDHIRSRGQMETRVSQTNKANVAMLFGKLRNYPTPFKFIIIKLMCTNTTSTLLSFILQITLRSEHQLS